jgi:hypothetical protein
MTNRRATGVPPIGNGAARRCWPRKVASAIKAVRLHQQKGSNVMGRILLRHELRHNSAFPAPPSPKAIKTTRKTEKRGLLSRRNSKAGSQRTTTQRGGMEETEQSVIDSVNDTFPTSRPTKELEQYRSTGDDGQATPAVVLLSRNEVLAFLFSDPVGVGNSFGECSYITDELRRGRRESFCDCCTQDQTWPSL